MARSGVGGGSERAPAAAHAASSALDGFAWAAQATMFLLLGLLVAAVVALLLAVTAQRRGKETQFGYRTSTHTSQNILNTLTT